MRATLSLLTLALALPFCASAQPNDDEGRQRWIPAIGLEVGFLSQDGASSSGTSLVLGPAFNPNPQLIRPADAGSGALLGATFAGEVELHTPALEIPGAPRLFGRVGLAGLLSSSKRINQEGSLSAIEDPGSIDSEDDIIGQGSATEADIDAFLVRVGLGISIALPFAERRVRFKPSFEYLREELTVSGLAQRAVALTNPLTSLANARVISFRAEQTQEFHGIGPGLELEAEAVRGGDFVWTVFAGGQAYYFLGDRKMELSASDAPPGPGFGESAAWTYEKDQWGFHVGVGMRIRWLPE